jgi:predicted TIM-barrel fold metal-dependent hydrolase
MRTDATVISADDHVNPPPTIYAERVPREWRERMPRVVRRGDQDFLLFEGTEKPFFFLDGAAGVSSQDVTLLARTKAEGRRGGWDPDARIEDMDFDGVDAQVLFGSGAGGGVAIRTLEKPMQAVMMRAYNDWLAEHCRAYPKRLIGIGELPVWDVEGSIAEARRCAKLGLRGVALPAIPAYPDSPPEDRSYFDPAFEPLWQTLEDLNLHVHMHLGTRALGRDADKNLMTAITVNKSAMCEPIATFIFSGILQRHPNLKLVSVESGVGWMAFMVPWMDNVFARHRYHTRSPLAEPPSFYFHRQVLGTFIDDEVGIRNRDVIGVESIMWSSDYPHVNSSWPTSQAYIERHFGGVPAAERAKMVGGNAAKLYGL